MSIVDSLHSGHTPDWRIDPHSTITERELVDLDKKFEAEKGKRDFNARFMDTISTSAAASPVPTVAPSRVAKNQKRYQDSIAKAPAASPAMGKVNLLPTSGIPKILNPQDLINPSPLKRQQDEQSIPMKSAATEGFLNSVKNFFWNLFGWGSTPAADVTGETPLAGSPKEQPQVFSERDLQAMAKALEQMSLAINQLIVQHTEQSKENSSENGDRESQIIQLKQVLNELQILKKVILGIKGSVTSKELQTRLAADEVTKNLQANKVIQAKHLENAENINSGIATAEWMAFINYGAAGIGGLALIVSIGVGIATVATGGTIAPALAAALATIGGTSSLVSAGSTTVKILQEEKTGTRQAENEALSNLKSLLQDQFKSCTKEQERSVKEAVAGQNRLIELSKNKQQMIQYAAQQLAR